MLREIEFHDEKLQLYLQEVINKAQIKKGCTMCEVGVSTAQASQVMGVSQWDIMGYLGKTSITDQHAASHNVKIRLQFARRLFQ